MRTILKILAIALAVTLFMTYLIQNYGPKASTIKLTPLTKEEKEQAVVRMPAEPREITIVLLSREEFDRRKSFPSVGGWAEYLSEPCRVYIPADFVFFLFPRQGRAETNTDVGRVVIHEVAHCLFGPWHRAWTEQEMGTIKEVKR